jgi:hypothetical protein
MAAFVIVCGLYITTDLAAAIVASCVDGFVPAVFDLTLRTIGGGAREGLDGA